MLTAVFPKLSSSWKPFIFEKITMDPHILAGVTI